MFPLTFRTIARYGRASAHFHSELVFRVGYFAFVYVLFWPTNSKEHQAHTQEFLATVCGGHFAKCRCPPLVCPFCSCTEIDASLDSNELYKNTVSFSMSSSSLEAGDGAVMGQLGHGPWEMLVMVLVGIALDLSHAALVAQTCLVCRQRGGLPLHFRRLRRKQPCERFLQIQL